MEKIFLPTSDNVNNRQDAEAKCQIQSVKCKHCKVSNAKCQKLSDFLNYNMKLYNERSSRYAN